MLKKLRLEDPLMTRPKPWCTRMYLERNIANSNQVLLMKYSWSERWWRRCWTTSTPRTVSWRSRSRRSSESPPVTPPSPGWWTAGCCLRMPCRILRNIRTRWRIWSDWPTRHNEEEEDILIENTPQLPLDGKFVGEIEGRTAEWQTQEK